MEGARGRPPATGDSPAPLRRTVTPDLPARYAAAARDFNAIHLSEVAAQAAGLSGVVLHGMCTLGWVASAIEQASGRSLAALSARFARPLRVGESVDITVRPDGDAWVASVTTPSGEDVLRAVRSEVDLELPGDPRVGGRSEPPTFDLEGALGPRRPSHRIADPAAIAELRDLLGAAGPGTRAPPTFAAILTSEAVFGVLADRDVPLDGTLHAAQQLWWARPLTADESVDVEAALLEDRTRSGLRRLVVRAVARVHGRPVAAGDWTLLRRVP